MELKHFSYIEFEIFEGLLIVPYGIETYLKNMKRTKRKLLIVPYGIETHVC